MSGVEVIGGISAVIAIIDALIKVYESARKDLKLPQAFVVVGRRLPIILEILQTCHSDFTLSPASLPPDVYTALEKTIDNCDHNAGKLREIFEKVIPGDSENWAKRYRKILSRPGQGHRVESLMVTITEDVRSVVDCHTVKWSRLERPVVLAKLEDALQELRSVPSSAPEEDLGRFTFNSGGGAQTISVDNGNGQHIVNHGFVGAQHFVAEREEDFSFRGPAGNCFGQAPLLDPKLFIGRDREMMRLKAVLRPGDTCTQDRTAVLGGGGGFGKTQLAIAYATRYQDCYDSIFWVDATTEATLKTNLGLIVRQVFDVKDPNVLEGERGLVKMNRWLSERINKKWLLIFDNYDNPRQFDIRNYHPALHGTVIVTSRRYDLVVMGEKIRVDALSDTQEGLKILATRSGRADAMTDPCAERIVSRLDGLPLAIATAGAYLLKTPYTFEWWYQEYEKHWEVEQRHPVQLSGYHRTLYTTWKISYDRLEVEDPDAARLLKLLAYFDNQCLWYELFLAGKTDGLPQGLGEAMTSDNAFASVMGTLVDYCFVDVQRSTGSWSIHNCVHDWTLAVLNKEIDTAQYFYAFECVAGSIHTLDMPTLQKPSYTPLAAHACRLTHHRFQQDSVFDLMTIDQSYGGYGIARLLLFQFRQSAAEQMYSRILSKAKRVYGDSHFSTIRINKDLAKIYFGKGDFQAAEQTSLELLPAVEKVFGSNHSSMFVALLDLSLSYRSQGKFEAAEQTLLQLLSRQRRELGPSHTSTLRTAVHLAGVYLVQRKLAEAEEIYNLAQPILEATLGPDHFFVLEIIDDLCFLYSSQGKAGAAEQVYLRLLSRKEKIFGPGHVLTLDTVVGLGHVYMQQGKLAKAGEMFGRAQAGSEKTWGPDHTITIAVVRAFGNLYRQQLQLDKAESAFLQARTGFEKTLGPNAYWTLMVLVDLGKLYRQQNKLQAAGYTLLRALRKTIEAFGTGHHLMLHILKHISQLYLEREMFDRASQMD